LLIMKLIRFGGHIDVALHHDMELVSIKKKCVDLDTFRELLKGVVKVMGYGILSRPMV